MNSRVSVRSYAIKGIDADTMKRIESVMSKSRKGPFGGNINLKLIDTTGKDLESLGKMTSYGLVKGASLYFGGYCPSDDKSVIDYGYCFQEVLLELTAMGLGTCWLGGTFNRSFIAKALALPDGMIIPAVSPVGYALKKRYFTDRMARIIAKSNRRRTPDKLFFSISESKQILSLDLKTTDEKITEVLNSVRFAPSASNKQPWRLIYSNGAIDLYWDFDHRYNSTLKQFNIQALDMGIALYHISRTAKELGLEGSFSFNNPGLDTGWKYVASWS